MSTLKQWWVVGLSTSLFLSSLAGAAVNVNNGNFYVAYTDVFIPTTGLNVDVTRTYNSRSNYVKGAFGVGWASEYEGYLNFEKNDVVYFEGGGGNVVRFNPSGKDRWTNNVFGPQVMVRSGNSYVLQTAAAKDLTFNEKGRLLRISDRNKNFIELVYDNDQLSRIRDNLNNQLRVSWKNFGGAPRIVLIEGGDIKARYEYSPLGNLVKSTGADGVPYAYSYDDEFNLTRIAYKDGSFKAVTYNKARDWVTRFEDRDGIVTQYDYISDSLEPEMKFGTIVTRTYTGRDVSARKSGPGAAPQPANWTEREVSRFWYEFRRRADGSKYNYRAVTAVRGVTTETIFTECCGTPQVISQWKTPEAKTGDGAVAWTLPRSDKRSTFFEYFEDGLLKKKTGPDGTVTALTYDPKHRKVASVARGERKVDYGYDNRGNLAWAWDRAENRKLDLTYDVKGRLTIVKEQRVVGNRREMRDVFFRYNAAGKPIEVKEKTVAGEGMIRISYGPDGEVQQILNAANKALTSEREIQTAQRVAATFQNLLEIVQPAGISLTPEG